MSLIKLPNGMKLIERPGYFGAKRDQKIAALNEKYGEDNWTLVWWSKDTDYALEYEKACRVFYEYSYWRYLSDHPELVDWICEYKECFDNDITNIQSGCDYTIQEAYSTHIQDIAVRNCLKQFGRWFQGTRDELLQIRSHSSNGFKLGPGNLPYFDPKAICEPSKCPHWANKGSVEDFWQSNKYVATY